MAQQPQENVSYDFVPGYGATTLLTASDEVRLCEIIAAGNAAQEALDTSRPTAAQRRALVRQVEEGKAAREQFIEANLRLVMYVARQFIGRGLVYADLVQEGTLGMMHALSKFDHSRGYKFSTYATPWIRQAIGRAIGNQGRLIRLPTHQVEAVNKLRAAQRALTNLLDHEPSLEDLAAHTGFTIEKIEDLRSIDQTPVSLHTPVGEDQGQITELGDLLEDTSLTDPADDIAAAQRSAALAEVMGSLSDRERRVLQMRFGFDGGDGSSLAQIGSAMGISRERVRQIEDKAMGKLRHPAVARALA